MNLFRDGPLSQLITQLREHNYDLTSRRNSSETSMALGGSSMHPSSVSSTSSTQQQHPETATVELIQADLRQLSNETRKKFPPIKEASESAILKIKTLTSLNQKHHHETPLTPLRKHCQIVLQPFLMGCDTKSNDIILLCLSAIQRLITHKILNEAASGNIVSILGQLMDAQVEEVKLLQTSMLLLTTTNFVHGATLSKCLVLCFRLHQSQDHQVNNTASAILRQSISQVFDRVTVTTPPGNQLIFDSDQQKMPQEPALDEMDASARDSWRVFHDLCAFSSGDPPLWLQHGLNVAKVRKAFCLEMIENLLEQYPAIFRQMNAFTFLLKEKVCNIVIKLFSPGCKYQDTSSQVHIDFVLTTRVLRLVAVLLEQYNGQLRMESEIFLTLLIKFCEPDKLPWQRAIAVEVLHKICWRARQLRDICRNYDLETETQGSTPIFEQLITSLSSLSSRLFHQIHRKSPENHDSLDHHHLSNSSQLEIESLDDLSIKKLALNSETGGGTKYYYLDVLANDNNEVPFVAEDYVLRMAIATQLDIMAAIIDLGDKELIKKRVKMDQTINSANKTQQSDEITLRQMISSSWSGLLMTLCLLFESAPDESTVNSVLDTIIALTAVAGGLNMDGPREALVGSLCRFALPPNYNSGSHSPTEIDQPKDQVLVMGQPLSPTTSGTAGFVLLTTRNIQVLRALLQVALDYGPLLGQAWSSLLNALQHLSWILGFKPNMNTGEMNNSSTESNSSTVLTTAITAELPKLSQQLGLVFDQSVKLDEVALHHLINALCEQSAETMDLAYGSSSREPSLFAVAKLIHVARVNLTRLEILWKPVTGHLLEVCQHTNCHFRRWGAHGLSQLIVSALEHKDDKRRLSMVLATFKAISSIPRIDVRTHQMKTVLEVLETRGDELDSAWPILLDILQTSCDSLKDQAEAESAKLTDSFLDKQITEQQKDQKAENMEREVLVKSGFKAIQLVVQDFLGAIPPCYLEHMIASTMRFGSQQQSLNIALTSIGLLWNIIDFLCHDIADTDADPAHIQSLWLCLYSSIGQLCCDARPEVRKSAGQTLFGTISAHGASLCSETWRQLFWEVLFPLLESVENEIQNADKSKSAESKAFLVHHSRDTKEKQWAETKRLTLNGLAKLFKDNKSGLSPTEWIRCWKSMLEYIEKAAYCDNEEIANGAMDSFQELLESKPTDDAEILLQNAQFVPKQEFLCQWARLLPSFMDKMKSAITVSDCSDASKLFHRVLLVPVTNDSLPFLFTGTGDDLTLTILQRAIQDNVHHLHRFTTAQSNQSVYIVVFEFYMSILSACQSPPDFTKMNARFIAENKKTRWVLANHVRLSGQVLKAIRELYQKIACDKAVINAGILARIIAHLNPFWLNAADDKELWIVAHAVFINILITGLPVVRQFSDLADFDALWAPLAQALRDFLFNVPSAQQSTELHIELSCKTVLMVKHQVLNYRASFPVDFILQLIELLQQGQESTSRDEFSRQCFEIGAGLKSSTSSESDVKESDELEDIIRLIESIRQGSADGSQKLAIVTRTLQLIRTVRTNPSDEKGVTEMAYLLQACRAILQSIIKDKKSDGAGIMVKLYELYPHLCSTISQCPDQLTEPIGHVLLAYHPFLSCD